MSRAWIFAYLALAILALGPVQAKAIQPIPFGFFKAQPDQLVFTSSPQTFPTGNCSGTASVQNQNFSGAPKNVRAPLSVSLSSSGGVVFYSDSTCMDVITSVTIATGTNTASFYFINPSAGNYAIYVNAPTYKQVEQAHTSTTNPFVWTGGGGNAFWSTGGNWSGGSAPGGTDDALFDSTCSSNCSPTISSAAAIQTIRMTSGYSGTITLSAALTVNYNIAQFSGGISTGSSTLTQGYYGTHRMDGGSFHGGSSVISMRSVTVNAGSYTATSGTLSISGSFLMSGSETFSHNSGVLLFSTGNYSQMYLKLGGSEVLNQLQITSGSNSSLDVIGSATVNGDFSCEGTSSPTNLGSGNINVKGALNFPNQGCWGLGTVTINGSTSQTLTGNSTGAVPSLVINSSGGTVSFSGTLNFYDNFTYTAGTFSAGTSAVNFVGSSYSSESITLASALTFNDLGFIGASFSSAKNLSGTANVNGTFTCGSSGGSIALYGGTIVAKSNLNFVDDGCWGSTLVKVGGTSNQSITGVSTAYIPTFEINSSGGTISLVGTLRFGDNFAYTAGTLSVGTSNVVFQYGSWSTETLTFATPITLNNVTFQGAYYAGNKSISGTFAVAGSLVCGNAGGSPGGLSGGRINALGSVSFVDDGCSGDTWVTIAGSTNQTVTGSANAGVPYLEINSTGGTVTLSGTLDFYRSDFKYTAGTVSAGTSQVNFNFASYNSQSITLASPLSLNHVSFKNGNYGSAMNLSGTLIVNGTLICESVSSTASLDGGTIQATGDVSFLTNGCTGSTSLQFTGSATTNLQVDASASTFYSSVTLNKTGSGQVNQTSNAAFSDAAQDFTITNGTWNMSGYDLAIGNNVSNSGGTLKRGSIPTCGTLTYGGTYTGAAPICP